MSNSMEKPMMDPVQEAINKIPALQARAREKLAQEPPVSVTEVTPQRFVITDQMRRDAEMKATREKRALGADY